MKLRRALIAALAPAVLLGAPLAGCGDLLGLKDFEPFPDGSADAPESQDGTGGDTATDSAAGDAPKETSPFTDSSMAADSSVGLDSSMGMDSSESLDSSTGMDSSLVVDSSMGTDACVTGSQSDPRNCGSCGHDCLGGDCGQGLCQPFTLATSVTGYDMVVSNDKLYWVDQASPGHVWTCTISNNLCPPTSFANNQTTPERITLGGSGNGTVFWSDYGTGTTADGTIMSLPLAGGTPMTMASGLWTPQGVAADATYLFWAQSYAPTPALTRLTLGGGTTNLPTGSGSAPTAVGVGGGFVYWTDDLASGSVGSSAEGSLSLGTVDGNQTDPYSLSVDGTYVYWADYTSMGTVWQYKIVGGAIQTVGPSEDYPVRVVSDANQAYWIDEGTAGNLDGSLVEWDVAASARVVRATGLARPSSLAMDANAVYFTTLDNGGALEMMVR